MMANREIKTRGFPYPDRSGFGFVESPNRTESVPLGARKDHSDVIYHGVTSMNRG